MRGHVPLLCYFGHHKAASEWIRSILRDACELLNLRCAYAHHPRQFDSDLKAFVEREPMDVFIYANAEMAHVGAILDQIRGFHVVRDPRDIAVSAYFSHLNSHPTDDFPRLVEHRDKLRQATKEEGLLLEFEFRRHVYEAMAGWDYSLPNILELKMEQIIQEPRKSFGRIFAFLGLFEAPAGLVESYQNPALPKLTRDQLMEIVTRNDFAQKTGGRKPGEEDAHSHYRKGVPGDWKNHFTEEHKEYFKQNFNELLVKLGYEKDVTW